jgi:hypothetical protein
MLLSHQKLKSPVQRKSTQKNDTTPRKPVSAIKPKLKEVIKGEDVEMDDVRPSLSVCCEFVLMNVFISIGRSEERIRALCSS